MHQDLRKFRVTLFKEKLSVSDNNVVDRKLNIVLELIKNTNNISSSQIAKKLNVTNRTAQRYLDKLKKQNKLKRIGNPKTGYWELIL